MRVDYYHTGNAKEERFSLDRVVVEPLPWPGNPAQPIDDTNRGKYLFEVDRRRERPVLYSRGFSSIYGEWETTGEAQKMNRTFSESLRFPAPDKPVAHRRQEARREERVPRRVDADGRSGGQVRRCGTRQRRRGPADQAARERRSGDEARPADSRRRLHRARARQVRARRAAARRDAVRDVAVQGAPERHQRLGARPPAAQSGDLAAVAAASTAARRSAPPTTRSIPSATC